jgi:hypothetical protein
MRKLLFFLLLLAAAAYAADDPWAKVKALKSGSELHVFKKGAAQPVTAKMDELTDENLLVLLKNEQVAIPKDQIERIDARPSASRTTIKNDSKTTDPDLRPSPQGQGSRTPGTTSSTSVAIGNKPDFETVYRKPMAPPAPKK